MVTDTSVATHAGHQLSGRRSFRKRRTVNPLMVPARYNFLYSSSRPAWRAAACGGRPRAGDDTTGTGEPVAPSTPGRGEGAECASVPKARLPHFTLHG